MKKLICTLTLGAGLLLGLSGCDLYQPDVDSLLTPPVLSELQTEVDEALQRAFSIDGPVLVDVVVAKEELAIPPQIKLEQAKGFSLYMLRAIISGRGDEVIELAKTNWLR